MAIRNFVSYGKDIIKALVRSFYCIMDSTILSISNFRNSYAVLGYWKAFSLYVKLKVIGSEL